jgi:hypothetical protein
VFTDDVLPTSSHQQTLHICVLDTHPLKRLVQLPAGSLFGLTKVEAYPDGWVLHKFSSYLAPHLLQFEIILIVQIIERCQSHGWVKCVSTAFPLHLKGLCGPIAPISSPNSLWSPSPRPLWYESAVELYQWAFLRIYAGSLALKTLSAVVSSIRCAQRPKVGKKR